MELTLSGHSITALQKIITGDIPKDDVPPVAPYRSGPSLVAFFYEFGGNDTYGAGFPSRWMYAEDKLKSYNGTAKIAAIIESALDPAHFFDTKFPIDGAVDYINRYLDRDGYRVVMAGKRCRLETNTGLAVMAQSVLPIRDPLSHEFIREQMEKCDRKILEADYDGAITNARSLVEAVLFEIEGQLDAARPDYDGDMPKLYKRVQKLLNLDPEKSDITEKPENGATRPLKHRLRFGSLAEQNGRRSCPDIQAGEAPRETGCEFSENAH